MVTLNLKKECNGYYSNSFDGITITVCNSFRMMKNTGANAGSDEWQLTIENEKNVLFQAWFKTKKEAMKQGAIYVVNNL